MLKNLTFAIIMCATVAPAVASDHIHIEKCPGTSSWKECAVIKIIGEIKLEDGSEFIKRTAEINNAVIGMDGSGGSAIASFVIGEQIHDKKYSTTTVKNGMCASACAFIWAAGTERLMGKNSLLLFHTPYKDGDETHADGMSSMMAGMYMRNLGYTYKDLQHMFGHGPDDWHVTINDNNNKIRRSNLTRQEFEAAVARQAKDADMPTN